MTRPKIGILSTCFALLAGLNNIAGAVELTAKPDATALQKYQIKASAQGELKIQQDKATKSIPIQMKGELSFENAESTTVRHRTNYAHFGTTIRPVRRFVSTKKALSIEFHLNARVVRAKLSENKLLLNSPKNPLTRDERDLLDLAGDPLAMVGALPKGDIKQNSTWSVPETTLLTLFNLDGIEESSVTGKLVGVKGDIANIAFSGKLTGEVHATDTAIDLTGTAEFDTKAGRLTNWHFTVKELREPSLIGPGFDITADVEVTASQAIEIAELTDAALGKIKLVDEQTTDQLMYAHRRGTYAIQYDSRTAHRGRRVAIGNDASDRRRIGHRPSESATCPATWLGPSDKTIGV